jgi:PAS domain S-box-containing protein
MTNLATSKPATRALLHKQKTHKRLEQTLDHMIDGCQIISPDYRYLYVNRTVARQGHNAKGQLMGQKMTDVYPGIENTRMFRYLKECMKYRKLRRMENEFTYPDGNKAWFELKMEPVPEGVLIFSQDITKRKKTEQELLAAMDDLRKIKDEINLEKITDQAILENIGEGLIAIDSKARIMMMNKAAEELTGLKASELVGAPITKIMMLNEDGKRVPTAKRPIHRVLRNGESLGPSLTGYYFKRKNGSKFPVGLTATPVWLNGKIIGAIEVFRDITKEQEIDRAKTEFVSIASHQLRTPLGLTKWYLEAIRQEGLDELPSVVASYLSEIRKSNDRVLKIVRELLSVSRIDQANIKDTPKFTNLNKLVKAVTGELQPFAIKNKVSLIYSSRAGEDIPNLYIDSSRLHEVIQNLIVNGIKYTPPGGSVKVSLRKKDRRVVLGVSDSGIGIGKKDVRRLFTKFFRAENAALRNPDGSGLGLYVVKSYVEAWGGTVDVKSQLGKGTCFTITLPLKEA